MVKKMSKEGLLESLEDNLKWFVLEVDANEFGQDANIYIHELSKNIVRSGYRVSQIFKKEDEAIYHIHVLNDRTKNKK